MNKMGITEQLARICARRPWQVAGVWAVLILVGGFLATGIGDSLTTEMRLHTKPESMRGKELIEQRLRGPERGQEFIIVSSESVTVEEPAFRERVAEVVGEVRALIETVESAVTYYDTGMETFVSQDRHSTLIGVTLKGELAEAGTTAGPLLDLISREGGRGGEFEVTSVGAGSINHTFAETSEKDLQRGEMYALPIALIVLLVVFGAAVAAGIPIALALVSVVVAVGMAALVGRVFDLSFFVINMITMIGLALGIDYSLFIIHRFREERANGHSHEEAIARAGATAAKAVLFSGTTVVVALAGLFIIPTNVYRSLAVGAIAVSVASIAASLTLLPAVLSLLGDRVDAVRPPFVGRRSSGSETGFWDRMTVLVMMRPVVSAIAAVTILVAMTLPLLDIRTGIGGVTSLPASSEPREAFELLEREFSGGMIAPVEIAIDGAADSPEVRRATEQLVAMLDADPAFGSATVVRDDAGTLMMVSVPMSGDPDSIEAREAVARVREQYVPNAFGGTSADVFVTGMTARTIDVLDLFSAYTPWVFAFVLGLSFVLLLVVFRSIVVPVKAILMNLLSVGAAYGMLVLVFQKGVGANVLGFEQSETIEAWLPLFLFAVLFGLSMDYHVFLLSRIRERFDETGDNASAVAFGMRSTSGLITGAALIMVTVFGGFAMGELGSMQQMGFGLAVAVILDATVIRSVLVPASMQLLGSLNWYMPNWLSWLPKLDIEGPQEFAPTMALDD